MPGGRASSTNRECFSASPGGRGWSLEKISVEMTAPRYMPLVAYADAWTTSIAGVASGRVVYVGDKTAADITRLAPQQVQQLVNDDAGCLSYLIGCAQALAMFPGVSRSGMTIASGLWFGMGTVAAADFSFLMAIPLITGAGLWEARHLGTDVAQVGVVPLLAGCVVAFVSGVVAIRFLVAMLRRGRFYAFAPYCVAVGLFTLAYALWHG